jgi:glycine dehydrogenase
MKHNRPDPIQDSPLSKLENHSAFVGRHIGPRDDDIQAMLQALGAGSLGELIRTTLPESIQDDSPLDLPRARNEDETLKRAREMSDRNQVMHSMIGMGYHDTDVPLVVMRNVLENPGWYTAYTPYQAEISQGRLEALLNFQQMVCDLTGMEIANASLLDEATAAAEAMTMLQRVNRKSKSNRFLIDKAVLPQTVDVVLARANYLGIDVVVANAGEEIGGDGKFFGILLQYPAENGDVVDYSALTAAAHENGAMVAVAVDLLTLVLLKSPGEFGADVVVGNSQRFGVPMGFGGPHAAFLATHDTNKRSIPGRIIGVSQDSAGRPALRMALQTREQHIRRDKATSNICTAQALLAVMAGLYAAWHGPGGLKTIANRVHRLSGIFVHGLRSLGIEPVCEAWFDTLHFEMTAGEADRTVKRAADAGINLRRIGNTGVGLSFNEKTGRDHVAALWTAFAGNEHGLELLDVDRDLAEDWSAIPDSLKRSSAFLEHPVFNRFHSETQMLRYLKHLENKDLSLTHAMISLGSCTMKLNATSEMIPITWQGFSDIHPFAPREQTEGYRILFKELEEMLAACTGYDAVSLQPNAGSQGEYAGLIAIRMWHESRGDAHRDVCLIPSSAHGTNPASAALAGMKIVVVACDENGNVDVDDLRAKAETNRDSLAALMITYPSTHGVFEDQVREICNIVHDHGGQVYLDGANLNALMGCAAPGKFGSDVSHLNLHKTFCIPHGGGGPGVGPICVGKHLEPFLPGHGVVETSSGNNPPISAAPWGSAGILPISWAYIAMMGRDGMKKATQVAILNANYIAHRLAGNFDVLYTGRNGRVAHECIVDIRPYKESCGIDEEDVAKRLIDYGFHSPTMSFPVPGTLMIEPTESESLEEMDRFCDAMLSIREEIGKVETGEWDAENNPLRNAPQVAAYPVPGLRLRKFWAPVSRVDNVYGDRNLVCSCPPMDAWMETDEE